MKRFLSILLLLSLLVCAFASCDTLTAAAAIAKAEKALVEALKSMLGIAAKVKLVAPKSITRSEGKAVRVIDKRKI